MKNIIGLKDACGDIKQSMELLLNPPADFSILCGEDILYYSTMMLGGDGGILASSHLYTEDFLAIFKLVKANDHLAAFNKWKKLAGLIPLLFAAPSPGPIKYCLKILGLINSSETRLPITEISDGLAKKLDSFCKHLKGAD